MKKLKPIAKGMLSYLKILIRPNYPMVARSANGHSILKDWETAPEENIIFEGLNQSKNRERYVKLGLYCYEGPHRGELLLLGNEIESLGRSADNSVVITPKDRLERSSYKAMLNGSNLLVSDTGSFFHLNGQLTHKAELFDFDELYLLGNKFIVLCVDAIKQNKFIETPSNVLRYPS